MKQAKLSFSNQKLFSMIVALLLASVMLLYLITFQVRVTQVAVVTTFGKPTAAITEPGLYWKLPYPFQNYFSFDARIQLLVSSLEETYTADSKHIIIETYIGWRIQDPILFLSKAGTIKNAQTAIESMLRHYTNSVIGKYTFAQLISRDAKEIRLPEIEQKLQYILNHGSGESDQSNEGLKASIGIEVKLFGIKRLELPKDTTKAVFDRMKEERNRLIQSFRAQGEGKAKEIRAQADAKREEILINAQAQAKQIRGQGDAAAAKHYAVFAQDRSLAIWLRKLDSLEKLLTQNSKITLVLDTRTPPFDLLHGKDIPTSQEATAKPAKPTETKPDEAKPVEQPKAVETQPGEAKPVEQPKAVETQPGEAKPVEQPKAVETQPGEAKPVEQPKTTEAQSGGAKPVEQSKAAETQSGGAKPAEQPKAVETQPGEAKPVEQPNATEPKPTADKPNGQQQSLEPESSQMDAEQPNSQAAHEPTNPDKIPAKTDLQEKGN